MNEVTFPRKFEALFNSPKRYKIFYGGRGSGKSHSIAKYLLIEAQRKKHRILCAREYQISIADSVHKLLSDQIELLGFSDNFIITKTEIKCINGSQFIFKGLHANAAEIKSMEAISIAWIEEAQAVSNESWDVFIPTIRDPDSQIIISFNPLRDTDPTYSRFVTNQRDDYELVKVNYYDNPWFPDVLHKEMEYDRSNDPTRFSWIWEGNPLAITEAQVFYGKYAIEDFDTPQDVDRFYYGADWGFSNDPTALVRCFIKDNKLYIDYEVYKKGIEIDHLPAHFDTIPGARRNLWYGDNARPETISYMQRAGFSIQAAPKWAGSVEDGIARMRGFEKVIIHERCKNTAEEFLRYSYAQDKLTGAIQPKIIDAWNHAIDAIRYALAPIIQNNDFRIL